MFRRFGLNHGQPSADGGRAPRHVSQFLPIAALAAGAASIALSISHAQASPAYTITDLGALYGGGSAEAYAVNDAGQVAGSSAPAGTLAYRAFLYSGGAMTNLGTLGGTTSQGLAINASGHVAGVSRTDTGEFHAFLYSHGTMADLGTLGGIRSEGRGVNVFGQVIGSSFPSSGGPDTFLHSGGSMSSLIANSDGYAINDSGQVAGRADGRAYLYSAGTTTDLGTLGGAESEGRAINETGQVAGSSDTGFGSTHAFFWSHGFMADLGTLGGLNSYGYGINDAGYVVGASDAIGSGEMHAFLYAEGLMIDLDTLIADLDPSLAPITFLEARDISNIGHIVVNGYDPRTRQTKAYLLTPFIDVPPTDIPLPASAVLLVSALAGLGVIRRRGYVRAGALGVGLAMLGVAGSTSAQTIADGMEGTYKDKDGFLTLVIKDGKGVSTVSHARCGEVRNKQVYELFADKRSLTFQFDAGPCQWATAKLVSTDGGMTYTGRAESAAAGATLYMTRQ